MDLPTKNNENVRFFLFNSACSCWFRLGDIVMEELTVSTIEVDEIIDNFTEGFETKTTDNFMDEVKALLIYKVATFIAIYWIPILVPIGLVGNTLSFLIMVKPSNRKLSTCIYMAAISVNDSMMLLIVFYGWSVSYLKIHKRYPLGCRIESFLIMFALQNATYQVVAMTIDKLIAIKWPHKAAINSTPRRAKMTIIVLYVCVISYNLPDFFLTKMIGTACVSYAVGGVYAKIYSWLTFIFNGIIPLTSLIVMNSTIIHEVRKSHNRFRNQETVKTLHNQQCTDQGKQGLRKSVENQLTVMLLLVTTLFLVLLIPTYARFLYFTSVNRDTPEKQATAVLFLHLSTRLYFTNSGINFFLYCISGKKFRKDLKKLFSFATSGLKKERTISTLTGHSDSFQTTDLQINEEPGHH